MVVVMVVVVVNNPTRRGMLHVSKIFMSRGVCFIWAGFHVQRGLSSSQSSF